MSPTNTDQIPVNGSPIENWISLIQAILAVMPILLRAWSSEFSDEEDSTIFVRSEPGKGNLRISSCGNR